MFRSLYIRIMREAPARTPAHRHPGRRSGHVRLRVEPLENRDCPSGGHLLVSSYATNSVLRYDDATGAFVDSFVPSGSGGLATPYGVLLGPRDHNVYVASGQFTPNSKGVLRYDGVTGAFVDEFVAHHVNSPRGIIFGRDGNLYVGDLAANGGGRVVRFDGTTGAFMDVFVAAGSGGMGNTQHLLFGPDGNLYVSNEHDGAPPNQNSIVSGEILRFDGKTGAFIDTFVAGGSGGLDLPFGMSFGADGSLYVASARTNSVLRYQGPSGKNPGAFIEIFVKAGSGGLLNPGGLIFGPDGNHDGRQDLYVGSSAFFIGGVSPANSSVKRYDGRTGAFIDTFITAGSGGLTLPAGLTFTESDPTTLEYQDDTKLMAVTTAERPVRRVLRANEVKPLLSEAVTRWQAAAVDTSGLGTTQIQIADLGGTTLGLASGHTIWLDDNAAGWGWFVDPTPWDDAEFTTLGNALTPTPLPVREGQGVRARMDLLSVLMHEVGHLLGYEHAVPGALATGDIMQETLSSGMRLTQKGVDVTDYSWLVGLPGLAKKRDSFRWWL